MTTPTTTATSTAQHPHSRASKRSVDSVDTREQHTCNTDETIRKLADAVRANDHDAVYAMAKCLVDGESSSRMAVPQLLSVEEIAVKFNLCTRSIWRLVASRELPQPIHVGSARRWYASEIEGYLKKQTEKRNATKCRRSG
jgi:predicted DNA-binding transcriptional regulator AlpA